MRKKVILILILILLIGVGYYGYSYYQKIYAPTVTKKGFLYVKTSQSLDDLSHSLKGFTISDGFSEVANLKKFNKPKAGRYLLEEGMSNNDIVNLLRSGNQTPLTLSFNNKHTLEKLSGYLATQLEVDSLSLYQSFTDSTFLAKNGFSEKSVLGMFIPNSYEVYWTTKAEKLRNRMLKEYKTFWNKTRLAKANTLGITPNEVITLASIVQKETAKVTERPTVAGLYINRLKRGILLQSDPTVIYAIKEKMGEDYLVKRVLFKDLKIDSPYNTYRYMGLPPTLIGMPDISSIDAVLNYQKHNYIYMCASVEKHGYHAFATNLRDHNRNAKIYQSWLNKKGVHR